MAFIDGAAAGAQQPPMLPGLGGAPMAQQPFGMDAVAQRPPAPPKPSAAHQKLLNWCHPSVVNIITEFEINDELLQKLGTRCERGYRTDLQSLDGYYELSDKAFDLAAQVAKDKNYPWPKASNVIYPLITTSAIGFASRAYPAIISGRNVVKGLSYGKDDGTLAKSPEDGTPLVEGPYQGDGSDVVETADGPNVVPGPDGQPLKLKMATEPGAKQERADRIGEHMSYQLLEQTPSWEEDTDKLLHMLPIAGCYFRKSWFDPMQGKNLTSLGSPKQIVINYKAKSMDRAPRISEEFELYPHEIETKFRSEEYKTVELGLPQEADGNDDEAPHKFIEQHCRFDLDEDGYAEPLIVTYHKESSKVVRVVARFDPEGILVMDPGHANKKRAGKIVRIEAVPYYTKYDFLPSIDGGLYGMGFGQLLNPINAAINTTLNMLLDAGHLQTTGGGFIGKGISMHSGSVRFRPGEWKVVNSPGQDIRNAMVPLSIAEPSMVLFQLLGTLIKAGEQIAASNDVLEGSANMATMQPTTMLALIEQGLKVFTAIYKRIHRCLRQEYMLQFRLNRLYLEDHSEYQWGDEWKTITREDYMQGAGVCPYSDPEMVSDMQQMARSQLIMNFKDDPRMDGKKIIERVLKAAKIEKPEQLFAKQQQPDPVIVATVNETNAKAELHKSQIAKHGMEEATERAKQAETWSKMLLNLANVEKIDTDHNLDWATHMLDVARVRIEGAAGTTTGGAPKGEAAGPGGGGEAGAGDDEEPPLPGARKAESDGKWYVPDPERHGKYLQVQHG